MNRSTQLLGLMAATAMVLPMGQAAGHPPKPIEIEIEAPENLELKQVQPNAESRPPSEGTLAEGDQVLREDGRRFDSYSFRGEAGTTFRITVTSEAFAPFVFLVDRTTGETIAQQVGDSDTVSLTVQLPNDGEYEFGVAAIEAPGEGAYQFNVVSVQAATGPQAEADRLLAQGDQQYENGQLEAAISAWEQALQLYEELGDLETRRTVLTNLSVAWVELLNRHLNADEYQQVVETAEILLPILVELGARYTETSTLDKLGIAYQGLGDYEQAIELHQEALEVARRLEDRTLEARILNNLGVAYDQTSQYELAIVSYEASLSIARDIGDLTRQGNASGNLGNVYSALGDYQLAVRFHEQSLDFYRADNNESEEVTALRRLIDNYRYLGYSHLQSNEYQEAITYFNKSLEFARLLSERHEEARALKGLAQVQRRQRNYDQAIEYLEQRLSIYREINDRFGVMISLDDIGSTYLDVGNYEQALQPLQEYLDIARELNDQTQEARALNRLGITSRNLGIYQQAISLFEQYLEISRGTETLEDDGIGLMNLANVYSNLGNYRKAIDYNQQALLIYRAAQDRSIESRILRNLGGNYASLREYEQAITFYEQGLIIAREIEDQNGVFYGLVGLARIEHSRGGIITFAYYTEALEIANRTGNPILLSAIFSLLGDAGMTINEDNSISLNAFSGGNISIANYERSLELARISGNRYEAAINLIGLARIYLQNNQPEISEDHLIEATDILDDIRATVSEDSDRISLFQNQINAFSLLQEALAEQGKFEAALEAAERGRGRALVALLSQQTGGESADLVSDISPNTEAVKQTAQQTDSTLVAYSVIRDVDEHYNFNRIFSGRGVGQDFNYSIYMWVVSPDGSVVFRELILNGFDLEGLIANTRDTMGVGEVDRASARPQIDPNQAAQDLARRRAETDENLRQLHQILIEPISDLLPTDPDAKVAFIPQGELFLVPFPALKDADGDYLIENHTILTAPSIQVLQLTHDLQSPSPSASTPLSLNGDGPANPLIVGDPAMPTVTFLSEAGDFEAVRLQPLYGARQEAEAVGATLNASALLGDAATEARVKQQIASAALIHLATHGLLEYGDPRQTGSRDTPGAIALAPGNGEDGLLTSTEILQMELQADLVVLSACDTGRGRITGDGVIGLSRSFIAAGVPSVIVSLWAVPDAPTADLMRAFYDQLAQGETKVQALRQAMLITMQTRPDPKDWAAFTLIGNAE
jgi:CHAT domain-containing protein/tetratricopeptide (TPR) repeat protein